MSKRLCGEGGQRPLVAVPCGLGVVVVVVVDCDGRLLLVLLPLPLLPPLLGWSEHSFCDTAWNTPMLGTAGSGLWDPRGKPVKGRT